jgi:hypothetical protein
MQELAVAQKRLEDLQAVRVGEAQKVWDFWARLSLHLCPLASAPRSGVPTQEVSVEQPLLDSVGAKMSELEDVIASRLEAEGRILTEAAAEHVLWCLCSYDPQVSLEPVVQGPAEGVQEAA